MRRKSITSYLVLLVLLASRTYAATGTDTGGSTTAAGAVGDLVCDVFQSRDNNPLDRANFIRILPNDTDITGSSACSSITSSQKLAIGDVNEAAADQWGICVNGADFYMIPNTGSDVVANAELFLGTGANTANYVPMSGDATITNAGVVAVADDSHAHTTTTLSGIDIGDDTNLAAGAGLLLTGDTLSTASTEAAFVADGGTTNLTCGSSNQGKVQVLDDGRLQWCDGAGTSVIQSAANTVNVRDYGAVCDGSTDDTTALTNAITAAPTGGAVYLCPSMKFGGTVITKRVTLILPPGDVTVSDTVTLRSFIGGGILGHGVSSSRLVWGGGSRNPMFILDDIQKNTFQDFTVSSSTATPLNVAFFMVNGTATSTVSPRMRMFRNILVDGTNGGLTTRAFQYAEIQASNADCTADLTPFWCCTGNGTGTCAQASDANNDLDQYWAVATANGGTNAIGWDIGHSQSVAHEFRGCRISGVKYGVSTGHGATSAGGAFMWVGGSGGGSTGSDFYLGDASGTRPTTIEGWDSEGSQKLLDSSGPGTGHGPIVLKGIRWSANSVIASSTCIGSGNPQLCCTGAGAGTCEKVVNVQRRGPLQMYGNFIGQSTKDVRFHINVASSAKTTGIAIGNYITSTNSAPFTVEHSTHEGWTLLDNSQNNNGTIGKMANQGDWRALTDPTDPSKILVNDVSGITTATSRTVTWPDQNLSWATANTASTAVLRDASGNFSAGTITGTLSGNATTATALAANPSDCGANAFATTIAANGNLTCATPTLGTDTAGNFIDSLSCGSGITGCPAAGEAATGTLVASLGTDISSAEIVDGAIGVADVDKTSTLTVDPTAGALTTNQFWFGTTGLIFEGSTANANETLVTAADPSADRTLTLPNESGTVCTTGSVCTGYQAGPLTGDVTTAGAAATIATSAVTTGKILDATVSQDDIDDTATLASNPALTASACYFAATGIICEGSTANTNETLIRVVDPSADNTIDFPNETGTVCTTGSVCSGYQASLSGISSTGTNNLTWTIDADGAGSEPANGAGLVIEGGSGTNITATYESTGNDLEFAGAAGGYSFDQSVAVAGNDGTRGATFIDNTIEPSAPVAGSTFVYALGGELYKKDNGDGTTERQILTSQTATLTGTSVPVSCTLGDRMFEDTDAADGARLYHCISGGVYVAMDSPYGPKIGMDEMENNLIALTSHLLNLTAGKLILPNAATLPGVPAAGQVAVDTDAAKPMRLYMGETANGETVMRPVNLPPIQFGTGRHGKLSMPTGSISSCPSQCASCTGVPSAAVTCNLAGNSYAGAQPAFTGALAKYTILLELDSLTVGAGHTITTNFTPTASQGGSQMVILVRGDVSIGGTINMKGKGGGHGTSSGAMALSTVGIGGAQVSLMSLAGAAGAASSGGTGGIATNTLFDWHPAQAWPMLWGAGGTPANTANDIGAASLTNVLGTLVPIQPFGGPAFGAAASGSGGCGAGSAPNAGTPGDGGGGLILMAGGDITLASGATIDLSGNPHSGNAVGGSGGGSGYIFGQSFTDGGATYTVAGGTGGIATSPCAAGSTGGSGMLIECSMDNTSGQGCVCLAGSACGSF